PAANRNDGRDCEVAMTAKIGPKEQALRDARVAEAKTKPSLAALAAAIEGKSTPAEEPASRESAMTTKTTKTSPKARKPKAPAKPGQDAGEAARPEGYYRSPRSPDRRHAPP